jgi:hypothetical protein
MLENGVKSCPHAQLIKHYAMKAYGGVDMCGPRVGLDDMEKRKSLTIPGLELRPLGCPTRSQSLYQLRYPGGEQGAEENIWT